jgi:4-amino-4-deoxy-L-arabinose transferase-like glycosyltransferase
MAVTTMHNTTLLKHSETQLWAGVLMGPIGWAFDEGLSYALTQHACSTGHFFVLHVITVCCLVFALAGFFIARHQMSVAESGQIAHCSTRDRSWWMARLGIASSLGFSLVIVALAVPKLLLSPCV